MSKLLSHLPALCNVIKRIAVDAGAITLDHFEEGMIAPSQIKDDGSPVTDADRLAEDFIRAQLTADFPDIPVIGEEGAAGGAITAPGSEYFWLVDPLDGTRDFVGGSPDYTVNIALIKQGEPVVGVIYAPAHGELYSAHGEGTAARWLEESGTEKPIRVRRPGKGGLTVITSRRRAHDEIARMLEEHKVAKVIRRASSLKFCAVASGKADLYPGLGQTCEWDTAAGQAILEAAGGFVADLDGNRLRYGDKPAGQYLNPKFTASNFSLT